MARPPPRLRANRLLFEGEDLVVFSYPVEVEPSDNGVLAALTPAQQQVAALVLAGRSNAEIARARGTAPSTVAKQLETIYRKLGIGSRADLAALVARAATP